MGALTEAVVFFKGSDVVKEMFFAEFEAVLDDVVGIPDFASDEIQAAFVQIEDTLVVTGVVFFIISFDGRGRVTGHWNIPLRHLLDHASYGPDLGAGPIRVACRSACPVAWYRRQLWDPDTGAHGTFSRISAAATRNRLGIISESGNRVIPRGNVSDFFKTQAEVKATPAPVDQAQPQSQPPSQAQPKSAPVFHRRYRRKLLAIRSAEQLKLATQAETYTSALESQAEEFTRQLRERELLIKDQKAKLEDLSKLEQEVQSRLDKQQRLLHQKTEELEALLSRGGHDYQEQMEELRKEYAEELDRRLKDQALQLEDTLHRRERELYDRSTEIVELRGELSTLREQNRTLMVDSDDKLLKTMVEKGVVFIAYHPGVEHLVISQEEMPEYLREPLLYVASRCEVSDAQYREWLAHYRLPICRATDDDMQYCGQPIKKVMRPMLFRSGESDRCHEHSTSGLS
ncbi:hypothetical protein [Zhongshania sp.]|mgnify:CR=1 FL=1|uniref:hypothetical protein n=1 Tax=Zhongshania sp. TaxID=1971902 RepID=UPI001B3ED447|nr:hypothetical protein [Zhongshania sp.]MBQ0796707.1 hypothetical protein [Zhongshania sp.]